MALLFTPGHFAHRAGFYHQMAQLMAAGIGVVQALEIQMRSPPSHSWRLPLRHVLVGLQEGLPLGQALKGAVSWFSEFERAILEAAEQSGRLAESFQVLARHYEEKAEMARQFLALALYPVLVLHVAVLIFPTASLQGLVLQGRVTEYVVQKGLMLGPLYLGVALAVFLFQQGRSRAWRAWLESLLHWVPVLGAARRALALARLSAALEALVNAGVSLPRAWQLAAPASGSPALIRAAHQLNRHVEAHDTPAEAIQRLRAFPSIFASQYASGEMSGKLDESLRWLQRYYQEEGSRKLKWAIAMGAGLLYFGVVLVVAWQVIAFYVGYFKQIQEVIP